MHNKSHDELSRNFEEFFLTNADEIADLVKRSPDVKQFQAQQLVCEMVQVSRVGQRGRMGCVRGKEDGRSWDREGGGWVV